MGSQKSDKGIGRPCGLFLDVATALPCLLAEIVLKSGDGAQIIAALLILDVGHLVLLDSNQNL